MSSLGPAVLAGTLMLLGSVIRHCVWIPNSVPLLCPSLACSQSRCELWPFPHGIAQDQEERERGCGSAGDGVLWHTVILFLLEFRNGAVQTHTVTVSMGMFYCSMPSLQDLFTDSSSHNTIYLDFNLDSNRFFQWKFDLVSSSQLLSLAFCCPKW